MSCASDAKFIRADPECVAHGDRRVFLQVLLQDEIDAFEATQSFSRQALRRGAVGGIQALQSSASDGFGQKTSFAQNLIQQEHSGAARGQTGLGHQGLLVSLVQGCGGRISGVMWERNPAKGAHAMSDSEKQDLPPAAQRALAEAEARRKKAEEMALAPELGGRDGPEPVRYGDWEKKGIAVDF